MYGQEDELYMYEMCECLWGMFVFLFVGRGVR